jgi:hypothetical protein
MLRPTVLTVRVTIIIVIRVVAMDYGSATITVTVVLVATIATTSVLVKQSVVKVSATIVTVVN